MDEFTRRSADDRRVFIEEAANRRDLTPVIVEKDFWVCWTLRRLITAPDLKDQITFKGGTSLSKAYGIIQRFSEDIDLTIRRSAPLIGEVAPPMAEGIGTKERERRTKALKAAASLCRDGSNAEAGRGDRAGARDERGVERGARSRG